MSLAPAPVAAPSLCQSLAEAFGAIPDTRHAHGRRYSLAAILTLCLVALLTGQENPSQIYFYGRSHPDMLSKCGFHPPKRRCGPRGKKEVDCPNEDTISACLGRLDHARVGDAIAQWIVRLLPANATVACDGKALRGTGEHVLEILANSLGAVLWQKTVGEKHNELSALEAEIVAILAQFPQLRLLTGDAMFCQKSIAKALIKARRDYFLQLKAPHLTDVALAEHAFTQLTALPPAASSEPEKGGPGGPRIVSRNLWVDRQVSGYGHGSEGDGGGWPGLKQVVLVRTTLEFLDPQKKPTTEDHVYLTSLSPTSTNGTPEALLRIARGHWDIENRLHHVKDRTMGEDACRSRRANYVLSWIRNLAVFILGMIEGKNAPEKMITLGADPSQAFKLIRARRMPVRPLKLQL